MMFVVQDIQVSMSYAVEEHRYSFLFIQVCTLTDSGSAETRSASKYVFVENT